MSNLPDGNYTNVCVSANTVIDTSTNVMTNQVTTNCEYLSYLKNGNGHTCTEYTSTPVNGTYVNKTVQGFTCGDFEFQGHEIMDTQFDQVFNITAVGPDNKSYQFNATCLGRETTSTFTVQE